jgi:hypothetical protein
MMLVAPLGASIVSSDVGSDAACVVDTVRTIVRFPLEALSSTSPPTAAQVIQLIIAMDDDTARNRWRVVMVPYAFLLLEIPPPGRTQDKSKGSPKLFPDEEYFGCDGGTG